MPSIGLLSYLKRLHTHHCQLFTNTHSHIKDDRVDSTRKSKVGTIEVVRYGATFLRSEYTTPRSVDFDQANKKDAHGITGGRYTMSTTKKGRLLTSKSGGAELRSIWSIGGELGRLSVEYHMGHSLQVR